MVDRYLDHAISCLNRAKENATDGVYCELSIVEVDMILDLLKEQEAVEPILKREGKNKNYNDYVCPICDNEVVYEQNFCSECGRPFLWEGR